MASLPGADPLPVCPDDDVRNSQAWSPPREPGSHRLLEGCHLMPGSGTGLAAQKLLHLAVRKANLISNSLA